jgi:hypothetical protein
MCVDTMHKGDNEDNDDDGNDDDDDDNNNNNNMQLSLRFKNSLMVSGK